MPTTALLMSQNLVKCARACRCAQARRLLASFEPRWLTLLALRRAVAAVTQTRPLRSRVLLQPPLLPRALHHRHHRRRRLVVRMLHPPVAAASARRRATTLESTTLRPRASILWATLQLATNMNFPKYFPIRTTLLKPSRFLNSFPLRATFLVASLYIVVELCLPRATIALPPAPPHCSQAVSGFDVVQCALFAP
eukprot:6186613-Pleurochrysis_carterae.AAC.2